MPKGIINGAQQPWSSAFTEPTLTERRLALLDQALIDFETLPDWLLRIGEAAYLFKWPGYEKEEGLLTELSLRRALSRFFSLDSSSQDEFLSLLLRFSLSDPLSVIPQACLLRALAFVDYDKTDFEDLAQRLESFSPEALLQRTTLLDVDPFSNDDPYTSWGTLEDSTAIPKKTHDEDFRNDGGKQNFRMTCVPSVTLLYRGEWDPAFSLQVRAQGFVEDPKNNVWIQEQRRMSRAVNYQQPPLRLNHLLLDQAAILRILDDLLAAQKLSSDDYQGLLLALQRYVERNSQYTLLQKESEKRLAELVFKPISSASELEFFVNSAGYFNPELLDTRQLTAWRFFSYQDEIGAILKSWGCVLDESWSVFSLFDEEQGRMLGMTTSETFTVFNTGDDFLSVERAPLGRCRQAVVDHLLRGQDLVLSVNGHVRLLADVRESPEGCLVFCADPETGAATWIRLDSFADGATIEFPVRAEE